MTRHVLVADIGGTNARFAIADVEAASLSRERTFSSRSFQSLQQAVSAYVLDLDERPQMAALAVAGPISAGTVHLTNRSWSCTVDELRAATRIDRLVVLNDFEALAMALPKLRTGDVFRLEGGQAEPNGVRAVLGPGTGLGVAALMRAGSDWTALASEGGHISFAVRHGHELALLDRIHPGGDHVSAERVLSGPGLTRLYSALGPAEGEAQPTLVPQEIVARAMTKTDPTAVRAVNLFANWLGRFAGDVALLFGARGGVYLGGGIAPNILFALGSFRAAFELKGRLSTYLADIPVSVITAPDAGLRGAAAAAAQRLRLERQAS